MANAQASPFTIKDEQRIQALHRVRHVMTGEAQEFYLRKYRPATESMVDDKRVRVFVFTAGRGYDGHVLPSEAAFEIQVPEAHLTWDDFVGVSALRHGDHLYRIVSPSPHPPVGTARFWRIWVGPTERVKS